VGIDDGDPAVVGDADEVAVADAEGAVAAADADARSCVTANASTRSLPLPGCGCSAVRTMRPVRARPARATPHVRKRPRAIRQRIRCNLRLSMPRATPGSIARSRAGDDAPGLQFHRVQRDGGPRTGERSGSHRRCLVDLGNPRRGDPTTSPPSGATLVTTSNTDWPFPDLGALLRYPTVRVNLVTPCGDRRRSRQSARPARGFCFSRSVCSGVQPGTSRITCLLHAFPWLRRGEGVR
jgi:hypothetical protein